MKLHTVFITYNRLELTKQAVSSYLETVSVPFTFSIVDNASNDGTVEWIMSLGYGGLITRHCLLDNRYPGYACNLGWDDAPTDVDFLHRADNDFLFLPGWCEEVEAQFNLYPNLGQLGLRTDQEEQFVSINTGGNCIIRRELWDKGLRYDESPWPKYPAGWTEDSYFSPAVKKMGYDWKRVGRPCIKSIAYEDPDDEYYRESWRNRNILSSTLKRLGKDSCA